jgi:hypothetical protein
LTSIYRAYFAVENDVFENPLVIKHLTKLAQASEEYTAKLEMNTAEGVFASSAVPPCLKMLPISNLVLYASPSAVFISNLAVYSSEACANFVRCLMTSGFSKNQLLIMQKTLIPMIKI